MKLLREQDHERRAFWHERRIAKLAADRTAGHLDFMKDLSDARVRARARRRRRQGELSFRRW